MKRAAALGLFVLAACAEDEGLPGLNGKLLASWGGTQAVFPMATDGENVYFSYGASVYRVPGRGGPRTLLFGPADPQRALSDPEASPEYLAASHIDANGKSSLAWFSLQGGLALSRDASQPPRVLQVRPEYGLTANPDGSFAWCSVTFDPAGHGAPTAYRATADTGPTPIPGCEVPGSDISEALTQISNIADGTVNTGAPRVAAADTTTAYVIRSSRHLYCATERIYTVDKTTSTTRMLTELDECAQISAVAVDDTHVYFTQSLNAAMSLLRIPKTGGASEVVQAAGPWSIDQLAMGNDALYWSGFYGGPPLAPDGAIGVIVRVPKPGSP